MATAEKPKIDLKAFDDLHGYAAMLANLEGVGPGDMQATLEEIQNVGSAMLALLDGEEA